MRSRVGYADALKVLGAGDSKVLSALDSLLGAGILGTAAAGQPWVLALLGVRDELLKLSRKLMRNVGERVRGARGMSRTELLEAAHAVLVVSAYFEALSRASLPVDPASLKLTAADRLALAGGPVAAKSARLVQEIQQVRLPLPAPHRPYEQVVDEIRDSYFGFSHRLTEFIEGLQVWDGLDETHQSQLAEALLTDVPLAAARRYEDDFRRLASECEEFRTWIFLSDAAASREAIARLGGDVTAGLAGLEALLQGMSAGGQAAEWPRRLVHSYRAQLDRPIAEIAPGETLKGLVIPPVSTGYVNPRFRVAEYHDHALPAEESWWDRAELCEDVQTFLAGYLTSPAAAEVPLVLLGQPGSGKSVLTKVLAARLPPDGYLPVRVVLRHVPADAMIQDQIEYALREVTGEPMRWGELVRAAGDAMPVVMLDGFDELLQGTGVTKSNYLEQVQEFQRREMENGRRVAVIVTSRTVVATRFRFPEQTVVAKMEPFDDGQIGQWLSIWNQANAAYFRSPGRRPLPAEAVTAHHDLAGQPLLLLMLSLFDADGNALQKHRDELGRAELYEGLLAKFVDRELDKQHPGLDKQAMVKERNRELRLLSIIALGMFNRGRKSISEKELDSDLSQLLPESPPARATLDRMGRALTRAELAVGRFFFIHRSQASLHEEKISEYEFLHATFGEYLVARLALETLRGLVKFWNAYDPSTLLRPDTELPDDSLWDLLSFTPLSDDTQTIGFLTEAIAKLGEQPRTDLAAVLRKLFSTSLQPRPRGYAGYEPRPLTVPARHAAYSANLLVLNVLAVQAGVPASTLFGTSSPLASWRSFGLLWRSQLDPAGWDGLVSALHVTHAQQDSGPDVLISRGAPDLAGLLHRFGGVGWLAPPDGVPQATGIQNTGVTTLKTAAQAAFLCAPELDLLVHAVQPLLDLSPQALSTLTRAADGGLSSVAHTVMAALIAGARNPLEENPGAKLALDLLRAADASAAPGVWFAGKAVSTLTWDNPKVYDSVLAKLTALTASLTGVTGHSTAGQWPALASLHASKTSQAFGPVTALLPEPAEVYAVLDPMMLAQAGPSFLAETLGLARAENLGNWATTAGLSVLAALPTAKLRALPEEDVEFVLASAASGSENAAVIQLIRDRYRQPSGPA